MSPRHIVSLIVFIISVIAAVVIAITLTKKKQLDREGAIIMGISFFGALMIILGGFTQIFVISLSSYNKSALDYLKKEIREVEMQIETEQDPDTIWYLENIILDAKVREANRYRGLLGMEVKE